MKRTAGLLFTLPALGVLSPRSKAEDASAPAYTSCKEECFDSPKCCPQILEGVDPDDCVELDHDPVDYDDFDDTCYNAGGGMFGLSAACCSQRLKGYDLYLCTAPSAR